MKLFLRHGRLRSKVEPEQNGALSLWCRSQDFLRRPRGCYFVEETQEIAVFSSLMPVYQVSQILALFSLSLLFNT